MNVMITDPVEIEAVERGEISGDFYSDGDVYAELQSLTAWCLAHGRTSYTDRGVVLP